jgi:hypothetical protein
VAAAEGRPVDVLLGIQEVILFNFLIVFEPKKLFEDPHSSTCI